MRLGVARRLKRRLLPGGARVRRVPFGIWRGLRLESNLHDLVYFWLGLYEVEIHRHVRRLASAPGAIFDIGAADGRYVLALARLSDGPVVAFEPDPDALGGLETHLAANPGIAQQVVVVPDRVGAVASDGVSTVDGAADRFGTVAGMLIDVEGAELDVLTGARATLERDRPRIVIEVHAQDLEKACCATLVAAGYRVSVVERRRWLREDRGGEHNRWLAAEWG